MREELFNDLPLGFQAVVQLIQAVEGLLVPMYADPPGRGRVRLIFVSSRQGEQDQEYQHVDVGRVKTADRPHSQGLIQVFDEGVNVDRVQGRLYKA